MQCNSQHILIIPIQIPRRILTLAKFELEQVMQLTKLAVGLATIVSFFDCIQSIQTNH